MQQPPSNSQQWSVAQFQNFFNGEFPSRSPDVGSAYANYANQQIAKDPTITPYVAAKAFLTIILVKGLGGAISEFAQATGGATAAAGKGIVTGAPRLPNNPLTALAQFFGQLGEANLWIRVGEVLVGLVLIAVGLARITNAVPIATKVAGVAAKGALL